MPRIQDMNNPIPRRNYPIYFIIEQYISKEKNDCCEYLFKKLIEQFKKISEHNTSYECKINIIKYGQLNNEIDCQDIAALDISDLSFYRIRSVTDALLELNDKISIENIKKNPVGTYPPRIYLIGDLLNNVKGLERAIETLLTNEVFNAGTRIFYYFDSCDCEWELAQAFVGNKDGLHCINDISLIENYFMKLIEEDLLTHDDCSLMGSILNDKSAEGKLVRVDPIVDEPTENETTGILVEDRGNILFEDKNDVLFEDMDDESGWNSW